MALKMSQAQINALAIEGKLREEDGRRVHKMSAINRHDVAEIAPIAPVIPEPKRESVSDELSRAMQLIARTIQESQGHEAEARTLIQDILNTTLKSQGDTLSAIKEALVVNKSPKHWTFDIVRNPQGIMTSVIAKEIS